MLSGIMKVQFLFRATMRVFSDSSPFFLVECVSVSSDIVRDGTVLLREATEALGSKGTSTGVFNSLPWERCEVIQTQDSAGKPALGMIYIYMLT